MHFMQRYRFINEVILRMLEMLMVGVPLMLKNPVITGFIES